MLNNLQIKNFTQQPELVTREKLDIAKYLLSTAKKTKNIADFVSKLELDNNDQSQEDEFPISSISTEKNPELSIFFILQNITDSWLETNNNLGKHQNVASFRCNCPSCCNETLPSNFVHKSSSVAASGTTLPNSNSNNLDFGKIEALLSFAQWNNSNTITYSFYEDNVFHGDYYGSETNVREVSNKVKENVREVFNWLEKIVEIDFIEVTETDKNTYGQIRYMLSDSPNYALAYYPSFSWLGGDVHLRGSYDHHNNTNGFQNDSGKHGYMTIIHETLHALGLKHPHSGINTLAKNDDNTTHTVMSYNFTGNSAGTPMPYDIAALQYLYGAKDHNTGDDTYTFNGTTDVLTVNGNEVLETSHRTKQTIWDSNGIDTLDFSQLSLNNSGYSFDLNPGGWSISNNVNRQGTNKGDYYDYGTSIAFDVTIENIIGSESNDHIVANSAANIFGGYDYGVTVGNDTLVNTDDSDILDLSGYSSADITQTQNGDNLLIDLGDYGSVTVEGYFVSDINNRLQIQLEEDDDETIQNPSTNLTIGEIGRIDSVNHNLQTIQLQGEYTNPIVFAQPLSYNGSDTSIIRITDVENDSISFYVQEAEYLDGSHTNESFSYMVMEAGTWQLADGTLVEVGTVSSNANVGSQWETVNFQSNFVETPVVFSQIQTTNNSEFIRTRQKNGTATGFSVALEKEENLKNSSYQQDEIGWLAISSGEGTWDGNYYQATNTGDQVKHEWYDLDLSNNFTETPQLLASIATYDGPNSSGLRSREITGASGSNIEIKIEEDQSLDNEMIHTTEDINFLAIQGTGILTAQVYNPGLDSLALEEDTIFDTDFVTDI